METPVNELSDRDLSDELQKYGFNPGPILPTTRGLYKKKLLMFRGASQESLIASRANRYHEVPDDEENSPPPKKRSPKPRKRVVPKRQEPETLEPEKEESNEQLLPDQSDTQTESQTGGGMSILIKLFVFFVVAFIVYLIIKNMEPEKRIPVN